MIDIFELPCVAYDYDKWGRYLCENDKHRLDVDFSDEPVLTSAERKLIFPSVRAFQAGEHSDGKSLKKAVAAFAEKIGKPEYKNVIEKFIKEENCHSSYLARYMNYHGEPKKDKVFLDRVFRKIRQTGGIFFEITVLETAEIVALSYYTALGNVGKKTGSRALVSICEQMLHDELPHIVLQSYTMSHMKNTAPARVFRVTLMKATTDAVWLAYRRLMKAGGYSYSLFRGENLGYLKQSIKMSRKMALRRHAGKWPE